MENSEPEATPGSGVHSSPAAGEREAEAETPSREAAESRVCPSSVTSPAPDGVTARNK